MNLLGSNYKCIASFLPASGVTSRVQATVSSCLDHGSPNCLPDFTMASVESIPYPEAKM